MDIDNMVPTHDLGDGFSSFPIIFTRDGRGDLRLWSVEIAPEWDRFRVVHGKVGGTHVATEWKKVTGKNIGRSNETLPEEQILEEVRSLYRIRIRKGYCWNTADVDSHPLIKPMLAQDFKKYEARIDWSNPVFVQPKLDGIRCIATCKGLWSRTGKRFVSIPHIQGALEPVFEHDPDCILDGEIYHHELKDDFQRITSLVRRTKLSDSDYEETSMLQYHVYDLVGGEGFGERHERALRAVSRAGDDVCISPTWRVETRELLDHIHRIVVEQGYEGSVIRLPGIGYEHKRSRTLLKRKDFDTEEFEVVSVQEGEGNWSGAVKRFELRLPGGDTFGAGVRGTYEALAKLLDFGETPDWATVRFFGRSHDGVPRFPVVVDYGYGGRTD